MRQAEFHDHVGAENICPNIEAALKRAATVYAVDGLDAPSSGPHRPCHRARRRWGERRDHHAMEESHMTTPISRAMPVRNNKP